MVPIGHSEILHCRLSRDTLYFEATQGGSRSDIIRVWKSDVGIKPRDI
jgi:hypothetical protein